MSASLLPTMLAMVVCLLLGGCLGYVVARTRAAATCARLAAERDSAQDRLDELATERRESRAELSSQAVVRDSLDRLHAQLQDLERSRSAWQIQLAQQVEHVRSVGDTLRQEAAALATALRKPQVRGRWGELHLRRAVELAGMVDRCDFTEQTTHAGEDGPVRPDLVIHLCGGRQVVVDAKVPLEAFLDAGAAADEGERGQLLQRHARQLRTHVDTLAGKAYWRALPGSPEFVVLFVPSEAVLAHALDVDAHLLDHAAARKVVLATPMTLIAMLRTVAHAWSQQTIADSAREVHRLGRELHDRVGTVAEHLDRLGRSLGSAVGSYNRAVGSLESRVLVSARRLSDLTMADTEIIRPGPVDAAVRPLAATELQVTDDVPAVSREETSTAEDARRRKGA